MTNDKSIDLGFYKFAQMFDHFIGPFAIASFIIISCEVISSIFFPVRLKNLLDRLLTAGKNREPAKNSPNTVLFSDVV